jgi:hypothetical protein
VPVGYYEGTFPTDQDVTFIWPSKARFSSFQVTGGRHLRIVGGALTKTTSGTGLRFDDCAGSVFLEGLDIDMSRVSADAINVGGSSPDVYLQNCRIVGVNGSRAGTHADLFQPQGPIGDLCVDRLTGRSNYQGFYLAPQQPISSVELRRVDLGYSDTSAAITYLLWLLDGGGSQVPYPTLLNDVWVSPRPGQKLGQAVWPAPGTVDGAGQPIGARSPDGWRTAYWLPHLPVTGRVRSGPPPDGDMVPAGSVGLGYISPGYA